MKTTPDLRRTAVRLAKSIADCSYRPDSPATMIEHLTLMADVLVDVADVFQVHAPIIHAAKQLVTPDGKCTATWQAPWSALVASVLALNAHDGRST